MNGYLAVRIVIAFFLVLAAITLLYVVWKREKDGTYQKPDYRANLLYGLAFCLVGVSFLILSPISYFEGVNFVFGLIFFAFGLRKIVIGFQNKDKWRTPQKGDHQE